MGIYIVLFILFFIGSITLKPTKSVVLLLALVLFVISAGRDVSVGIDTVNYYQNGFSSLFEGENHQYEIVFVGLCDFIRTNGLNPRCCLYLLSAVTIFFICAASRRFKTNTIFVLFFFLLFNYFTNSLNIARQMAACSILLYANSFLFATKENVSSKKANHLVRDIVLFLVFVLLAASFHVGAILGLIALLAFVIPFEKWSINPMIISIILIVSFAAIQIGREILLSRSMGMLSTIAVYDSIGSETTGTTLSFFGFLYRSIAYIFYGSALAYLKSDSNYKLCIFFLVSLVIRILLSAFYGSILRLGFYFSLIDIVVFSICVTKKESKRKIFFYLATLYFGIDYFLTLSGNTFETVPYVFNMIEIF